MYVECLLVAPSYVFLGGARPNMRRRHTVREGDISPNFAQSEYYALKVNAVIEISDNFCGHAKTRRFIGIGLN